MRRQKLVSVFLLMIIVCLFSNKSNAQTVDKIDSLISVISDPDKQPKTDLASAQLYNDLATEYFENNQLTRSKNTFKKIIKMIEDQPELGDNLDMINIYLCLYRIDTLRKNYTEETFEFHNKYLATRDSAAVRLEQKKIKELEETYQKEEKDDEIKLLTTENEIQKANIERERYIRLALIIGSTLILLLLGISISRYIIKKRAIAVINEQKGAIEKKSHENELLIQEIHHRVKNNLQIILSLLNAQKSGAQDNKKAWDIIVESQNKIKSMALIHENLYDSENFTKITTADYFKDLIGHIKNSYNEEGKKIEITSNIEDNEIKMTLAVPLGLIVNELVTNSYKYAFDDNSGENMVTINFSRVEDENTYKLEVFDNGTGLPEGFDIDNTTSFGLQMIKGLTHQVNGKMEFRKGQGTGFDIYVKDNGIEKVA